MKQDPEYLLIKAYYGDRRAVRSGLRLMNHIEEGLAVLDQLGAGSDTAKAFCLHPLIQADDALRKNHSLDWSHVSPRAMLLAMEYRGVANAYLSHMNVQSPSEIRLSPLDEVNLMLKADKLQNRKDFERHYQGNEDETQRLAHYFNNWFVRLDISEDEYKRMLSLMDAQKL